jgi:hypothetical protein
MYDGCPCVGAVNASEDSMESSEEMVTPRAAGSGADEDERKAAADVPVELADQAVEKDDAEEEVMVDALPPETSEQAERQGKDDAEVEVHAVVQEPEVKDVVVSEAPVVEVPEVKREVAKVHPVHEPEPKVDEAAKVHPVHEPEPKVDEAVVVGETPTTHVVQVPEVKGSNVVVKDSSEVSRSQEVDMHITEVNNVCD